MTTQQGFMRIGLTLTLWVALLASSTLQARAENLPPRLAAIDLDQIIEASQPGIRSMAGFNELMKAKQAEARSMEEELKRIRAKAVEESKTGNPHQLEALQRQFNDKMADMRQFDAETRKELEKQRLEAFSQFKRIAAPVIRDISREMGYTLIVNKKDPSLIYVDDLIDITELVIQRLNDLPAADAPTPSGELR